MPPKVRIRRFGVLRTSTVVALLYFLVFVILFVPLMLLIAAVPVPSSRGGNPFGATGGVALVLLAIVLSAIYALLSWVFTAIACLLYNLVAKFTGGIEVEVERFGGEGYAAVPPYAYPPGYGQVAPGGSPGYPPATHPATAYPPSGNPAPAERPASERPREEGEPPR